MLKRLDVRGVAHAELRAHLPQPSNAGAEPTAAVREILAAVEHRGDAAVRELTRRFDDVALDDLRVPDADLRAALEQVEPAVRAAMEVAAASIADFQRSTLVPPHTHEAGGVTVRSWRQPVARAGCYVPGGRARYPSTV